jgi:5-methylcytosine-specific restriction protein A
MPTQAPRPCSHPGCRVLVTDGARCEAHRRQSARFSDAFRKGSTERGYGGRWQRARAAFLAAHPVCSCGGLASVVDHITPHKGDAAIFWDSANWQPLCEICHNRKTAAVDGGFGREIVKNAGFPTKNAGFGAKSSFFTNGEGVGQKSNPLSP